MNVPLATLLNKSNSFFNIKLYENTNMITNIRTIQRTGIKTMTRHCNARQINKPLFFFCSSDLILCHMWIAISRTRIPSICIKCDVH